jgi:hypothetical protein
MVWVAGHWAGSHKPCRSVITNNQISCNHCLTKAKQREMGYLPVYDEHLRQCVVGIGPDMRASVQRLKTHQPVQIKKGRAPNDPIIVKHEAWTAMPCYAEGRQGNPQDIEPWLLQLWGDEELIQFFTGSTQKDAVVEMVPKVIEVEKTPKKDEPSETTATILKGHLSRWKIDPESRTPKPPKNGTPETNGHHT